MNNTQKIVSAIAILFLITNIYTYITSESKIDVLNSDLASTTATLESTIQEKSQLQEQLSQIQEELVAESQRYEKANQKALDLKKVISIDKQLLQKYSKVFFLNENYTPKDLKSIKDDYLSDPKKEILFQGDALQYLTDMFGDAEDDRIDLKIVSGYRSFGTQASIKSSYTSTFGSGANAFSADQGYSEHQLGTTVDISTPTIGNGLVIAFDQTEAFKWLQENAYRYGFILSYPKGNKYYQYEPWHWRFVGTDLARYLHRKNLNFYDMEQRDIDKYIGELFD
jgi:D-alanyl-D-alanine carboxypeptidase